MILITGPQTDHGDHRDIMLGGIAAQNIIYSCRGNPVELTDNVDLEFAKNKVSLEHGASSSPVIQRFTGLQLSSLSAFAAHS